MSYEPTLLLTSFGCHKIVLVDSILKLSLVLYREMNSMPMTVTMGNGMTVTMGGGGLSAVAAPTGQPAKLPPDVNHSVVPSYLKTGNFGWVGQTLEFVCYGFSFCPANCCAEEHELKKGWANKSGHFFTGIKPRFFVLRGDGTLDYFEDDKEKNKKGSIALGRYLFSAESSKGPHDVFLADQSSSKKDYFIQFNAETDKESWLVAMKPFLINGNSTK